MSKDRVHFRTREVLGWSNQVWEVACQRAWVSRSTHALKCVTCKRCLTAMQGSPSEEPDGVPS